MNIEVRWQGDDDTWHTGTLIGFVPWLGGQNEQIRGGIAAMVALKTGRIVEMDYTRLRVGKEFQR